MKINPEKIAVAVIFTLSLTALLMFGSLYFLSDADSEQDTARVAYPLDLSGAGTHVHDRLEVESGPAPAISFTAHRDAMKPGNFNLEIETDNFQFSPERISEDHVPGEGHAHVFVDDVKIGRAYGPWFHVPKLKSGKHVIKVVLSTNNHRDYTIGGEIIQATKKVTVE